MLPPELMYDVIAEIVAGYIDFAITIPCGYKDKTVTDSKRTCRFIQPDTSRYHLRSYQTRDDDELSGDELEDTKHGSYAEVEECSWNDEPVYLEALASIAFPVEEDEDHDSDDDDDASGMGDGSSVRDFMKLSPEIRESIYSKWRELELKDSLPPNPILSLLSSSHAIRSITHKVLFDALGIKSNVDGGIVRDINLILHDLRQRYRNAQELRFPYEYAENPYKLGPVTKLIDCYLCLSFCERLLVDCAHKGPISMNILQNTSASVVLPRAIPPVQEVLASRVMLRTELTHVRTEKACIVGALCEDLNDKYSAVYTHMASPQFQKAVRRLDRVMTRLEVEEMDIIQEDGTRQYPCVTGEVTEALDICVLLAELTEEKKGEHELLDDIIDRAGVLLHNWNLRLETPYYDALH